MTIVLNAWGMQHSTPFALPAFRMLVVLKGRFDVEANRKAVLAIFDLFAQRFDDEIAFVATEKFGARSGANPIKQTPARIKKMRADLEAGMPGITSVKAFGTDQNPTNTPMTPYFRAIHVAKLYSEVEIALPWDLPDLKEFADRADAALAGAAVCTGYQSMGFLKHTQTFNDKNLPPAFERYKAAVMGNINGNLAFLPFQGDQYVRRKGPYEPGILETGWRTYVGEDYRGKLGSTDGLDQHGVSVEAYPGYTKVTAGPAPIWGDMNAGEDISAYTAAHQFVLPAYCGRDRLIEGTLWGSKNSAEGCDLAEQYLNRFLPEDTP